MKIPRDLYEQMVEHAREEAPNECVGLIATRNGSAEKLYRRALSIDEAAYGPQYPDLALYREKLASLVNDRP